MSMLQRKITLSGYNYFVNVSSSELTSIMFSISVHLKICSEWYYKE